MNQHLNEQYDPTEINAIWQKAVVANNNDPDVWRKDKAGAWIKKSAYGDCNSVYGWEVDHIKPVASGGPTQTNNLQPLNWRNNRSKGDTYPGRWVVATISSGVENIDAPNGTTCL